MRMSGVVCVQCVDVCCCLAWCEQRCAGDQVLLVKATDIGNRLLKAFDGSPSGLPYPIINLRTGVGKTPTWNRGKVSLSEIGSCQLEFESLSHHTGALWCRTYTLVPYVYSGAVHSGAALHIAAVHTRWVARHIGAAVHSRAVRILCRHISAVHTGAAVHHIVCCCTHWRYYSLWCW